MCIVAATQALAIKRWGWNNADNYPEKIKQVEGNNYPLVDASDVEMPDGTRLDATVQQAGEALAAAGNRLNALETPAESVDLTDFESDGTIIERRPDGSTVETISSSNRSSLRTSTWVAPR